MTFEEKVAMWSEKKRFIEAINNVFQMKPAGSLIEKIEYEVYQKEIGDAMRFKEWLVLRFEGGALGGVYAATSSYPGRGKFIEITGTKGTLVIDDDNGGSSAPDSFPYIGHQRCIEAFGVLEFRRETD